MNIPKDVKYILNKLNDGGYESYIVGGCVRDYLLGKTPVDFDVTTDASPYEVKELFNYTFDTGIKHGTVTVVLNGKNYEVTTYRIDGEYKNFRQPEEVFFTDNIYLDLSRRDFTMNAIAYHPDKGFVDPFNGMDDIENKIIKGVGDAHTRFNEDALRMLRAVRFSAQIGFFIEDKTYEAIIGNALLIKNISIERIREEFLKLIVSDNPEKLKVLKATGLLTYFLPEIIDTLNDSKISMIKNAKKDTLTRLCLLFTETDKSLVPEILKRMKLDNKTIKNMTTLLNHTDKEVKNDPYEIRRLLSSIGCELFLTLIEFKKALGAADDNDGSLQGILKTFDAINANEDCLTLKQLSVNGGDILALGIKKPAMTGEILNSLLDIVLREPDKNNRDYLMAKAGRLIAEV